MCGIVGIISQGPRTYVKNQDKTELAEDLLLANTIRGQDGTGFLAVTKDTKPEVIVHKAAIDGVTFLQLEKTKEHLRSLYEYKFWIGHNRLKSQGMVNYTHTHPFVYDHIHLVHNGHIANMWTLGEAGTRSYSNHTIDSQVITELFAKEGYKKIIPKITGAAALAWYDAKEDALFLYRNKERPLYFAVFKNEKTTAFASEVGMLKWICGRRGFEVKEYLDVGENQVVMFKDSNEPSEVLQLPPEPPPAVQSWVNNNHKSKPKDKPKIVSINKADEHLNRRSLVRGNSIDFYFRGLQLKDSKSRHGMLIGATKAAFSLDGKLIVKAYGIPTNHGFIPDELLEGVITGVEEINNNLKINLIVKEPKKKPGSAIITSPTTDSIIEDKINPTNRLTAVGPGGIYISIDRYREYVKDGCGICSASLTILDAPRLRWTVSQQPICPNHDKFEIEKFNVNLIH